MSKKHSSKASPVRELKGYLFEVGETLCHVQSVPTHWYAVLDNEPVPSKFLTKDVDLFCDVIANMISYAVLHIYRDLSTLNRRISLDDPYAFLFGLRPRSGELFFMVWYDKKYLNEVSRYVKDNLDIHIVSNIAVEFDPDADG